MNRFATVVLSGALVACGGGSGTPGSSSISSETNTLSIPPVESIPVSAKGIIELGPIAGGQVVLSRAGGNWNNSAKWERRDYSMDKPIWPLSAKRGGSF